MKPLALVRWQDAHSDSGQHAESDIPHEALAVHTAGYLLRDDERGISIAAEFIPESDNYRAVTFIPRALVLAVEHLSRPRVRRHGDISQRRKEQRGATPVRPDPAGGAGA